MTPETRIKLKVKRVLHELGAYYAMPATGGDGLSGTPDFLVCYRGAFVAIECKAGGNKPTALQEAAMQRIRDAGGRAFVVDENNISKLEELIKL